MAVTLVTDYKKERFTQNLLNGDHVMYWVFDFTDYSSSDVTIGAGDTLEFEMFDIPSGVLALNLWVSVDTANGGALTATITDASSAIHAGTYDCNAAGIQNKALSTPAINTGYTTRLVFPNNGVVKPALNVTVGFHFVHGTTRADET